MNKINVEVNTKEQRDDLIKQLQEMEFKKEYPMCLDDIERPFYIDPDGEIDLTEFRDDQSENHTSTTKRAKQILTLIKLLEFRDSWNEVDGGVDFCFTENNYCICHYGNNIIKEDSSGIRFFLHFRRKETRDLFYNTFKEDIETIKDLI